VIDKSHRSFLGCTNLSKEPVEKVLANIGLTEKEIMVYIHLGKHSSLKGLEIARLTRIDRAEVYRILKNLQEKGLVQSTLEAPARFTAVQFEKVLDSYVKSRRDELSSIEQTKQTLIDEWNKISRSQSETTAEKIMVITGDNKICQKICQMARETERQFSAALGFQTLLRANQLELFNVFADRSTDRAKFHFITDISKQNVEIARNFLKNTNHATLSAKGRSPNFGLPLSPEMILQDDKELLLFINHPNQTSVGQNQTNSCLWTDCRELIKSFSKVFENLWENSSEIQKKIHELETGTPLPKIYFSSKTDDLIKEFSDYFEGAKSEILILTSDEALSKIIGTSGALKQQASRGVAFKIMAPLSAQNVEVTDELSDFCEFRHIPKCGQTRVLIDGQFLFQFNNSANSEGVMPFEDGLFTDYGEYVENERHKLNNLWNYARAPSKVTLESLVDFQAPTNNPLPEPVRRCMGIKSLFKINEYEEGVLTEKEIVDKIIKGKRVLAKDPQKDIIVMYGSEANCIIHPPSHLELPEMLFSIQHYNKQSSWGAEDIVLISLHLETSGQFFVPVAIVTNNPESVEWRRKIFAGLPAGNNVNLFRKNQLEVRVAGNTFFVGWTKPIMLKPTPYILPPCCILFEGNGRLRTIRLKSGVASGRSQVYEVNKLEAFVTFFHPESNYQGPGTDGCLHREQILTGYPPAALSYTS
jgi:sugar-specific transcriptional regulator TrmB